MDGCTRAEEQRTSSMSSKPVMTRVFSSSQPMPPAPMHRTFDVLICTREHGVYVNKRCGNNPNRNDNCDYQRVLHWTAPGDGVQAMLRSLAMTGQPCRPQLVPR